MQNAVAGSPSTLSQISAMKPMCRSRLWVVTMTLVLAGCADMVTSPTRVPPDQASFAVTGADEADGEVHLHFEGMHDRWWVDVGFSFYKLGILIEGGLSAQIVGVEDFPGFRDPLEEVLPKSPGSTVLDLGNVYGAWNPSGYPYHSNRFEYRFTFFDPVSEFSMRIYPENDSELTCYDRQDRIVGTDFATGAWSVGYGYSRLTVPYVEQTLEVSGTGITRCVLEALGGAIDDIRFRRSGDELNLTCTGDLGENRVTRGAELSCEASGASEEDEVEIESWSFTGVDSRGQPYRFPDDMDRSITGNPWRGKMAISGTVHVRATINGGEPQERTATVTVQSRGWETGAPLTHHMSKVSFAEFPAEYQPPLYPKVVHDLGRTHFAMIFLDLTPDVAEQISDLGPNNYLVYLKRVPAEPQIKVLVHPEMETRGDFWRRQASGQPAFSQDPPCVQSRFPQYIQQILAHEGYPPNPQSHVGVYLAEISRRAGVELEPLAYSVDDLPQMVEEIDKRVKSLSREAHMAAKDPVDRQYGIPFGCEFNFGRR